MLTEFPLNLKRVCVFVRLCLHVAGIVQVSYINSLKKHTHIERQTQEIVNNFVFENHVRCMVSSTNYCTFCTNNTAKLLNSIQNSARLMKFPKWLLYGGREFCNFTGKFSAWVIAFWQNFRNNFFGISFEDFGFSFPWKTHSVCTRLHVAQCEPHTPITHTETLLKQQ